MGKFYTAWRLAAKGVLRQAVLGKTVVLEGRRRLAAGRYR